MTKIWTSKFTRFLSFHSWHIHSIIINKNYSTIFTNEDIVWFQISMCESLRNQPLCQLTETICQHLKSILVIKILTQVLIQSDSLHPIHQQYRELCLTSLATIHKQLLIHISERHQIRRLHILQFLLNQPIAISPSFLITMKTTNSIQLPIPFILHLEHHSKITTRHHGLSRIIQHGSQIIQFLKVVFCQLNGFHIFRNQRIIHGV